MPIEKEESLIICSNNQNITNLEITNQIKSWQIVDQYYDLIDRGEIIIHDIYFDTLQKNFQKKKVSFRIREINNKKLITIKIPTQHSQRKSLSQK
jgi:inorganic triphosphatase YgiF